MRSELTKTLQKPARQLGSLVNNHPIWSSLIRDLQETHTDINICFDVGKVISPDSIWAMSQPWAINIESIVKDLNYDKE